MYTSILMGSGPRVSRCFGGYLRLCSIPSRPLSCRGQSRRGFFKALSQALPQTREAQLSDAVNRALQCEPPNTLRCHGHMAHQLSLACVEAHTESFLALHPAHKYLRHRKRPLPSRRTDLLPHRQFKRPIRQAAPPPWVQTPWASCHTQAPARKACALLTGTTDCRCAYRCCRSGCQRPTAGRLCQRPGG